MSEESINLIVRTFTNPVFLSGLSSWLVAQILKAFIELFRDKPNSSKEILLHLFWTTGGMPSSHSSLVSALATSVGFEVGIDSPLFAIAFFYALLTIRDALGVRRAAGAQAKAINQMFRELRQRFDIRQKPVKEIHGHTVTEVSVGVLIGFFIAVAFSTL